MHIKVMWNKKIQSSFRRITGRRKTHFKHVRRLQERLVMSPLFNSFVCMSYFSWLPSGGHRPRGSKPEGRITTECQVPKCMALQRHIKVPTCWKLIKNTIKQQPTQLARLVVVLQEQRHVLSAFQ